MKRKPDPNAKPVLDAVTEAIGALTELVRSLRANSAKTKPKSRPKAKGARVREVKRAAKQVGRGLKARVEHAWDALTHDAPPAEATKTRSTRTVRESRAGDAGS